MTETTTTTAVDDGRADLLAELADAREVLIGTIEGLTDEQLSERPTASALCLGGLIKHVASTEAAWGRFVVEGTSAMATELPKGVTWEDILTGTARTWPQWAIDRRNDFRMLDGDTRDSVIKLYRNVGVRTEEIIAGVTDLSRSTPLPEAPWNEPGAAHTVRRVLIHLVAETRQHTGHAEILRETIDGRTTM